MSSQEIKLHETIEELRRLFTRTRRQNSLSERAPFSISAAETYLTNLSR